MTHEANPTLKSVFDARIKIHDQQILFDKINIVGIPTDPYTPYFKTNNFFQRTLSHLLGFDNTNENFRLLQVDSSGNLKVSATVGVTFAALVGGVSTSLKGNSLGALKIDPSGRQFDNFDIFLSEAHPASALLTSAGIDISGYEFLSLNVFHSQIATVDVQVSDDNVNWYEIKNASDADLTWNVTNEKINFTIPNFSRWLRVRVLNTNATAGTTTVILNAKA